jgi:NADPH-dependent 2,4-dienoyl-CoA reductase/sulfur reductase-like enzyme
LRYVIVGAGPAGVVAAETLRRIDPQGSVTLVGDEPEPPYSRMAIPYLLTGRIAEAGTHLRKEPGHYERLGISVVRGRAERLDTAKRTLAVDGRSIPYDHLLIATGSTPVKPPVAGLDRPGVLHCWTLADARAIAGLASKGSDVVLLGAGFIGCIIMEALAERGVRLTVVEMGDRMVPRMMNQTAGTMIKRWCEKKGVRVLTSTRIKAVETAGADAHTVILESGERIPAHLVVVAAGVRSNMDFLAGSGVATGRGVLVNDRLRTSVAEVYAAGDVAEGPDFSTGGRNVHAIQPTAADHGRIAALNMAGREAVYKGSLIMNVLDTLGLVSASFGQWEGVDGGDYAESVDATGFRYIRLEFADDRLVGALSLGRTEQIGVLRGLIQSRVRLGDWKARLKADPHRVGEAYVACTQTL